MATMLVWPTFAAAQTQPLHATIRTTSYGIPHIKGATFADVGYGHGYAYAKSAICEIATTWLTVRGERSKYLGADTSNPSMEGGSYSNADSDFFWKRLRDIKFVATELAKPAPQSPSPDLREMVRGYVAGYNQYLRETGVDNLPDGRCRHQAWVTPISEEDVYLRALLWNLTNSSNNLYAAFARAAPPSSNARAALAKAPQAVAQASWHDDPGLLSLTRDDPKPGSNMIALGRDATQNRSAMIFANPHWFWQGGNRWWEAQLTVPGKLNVYGAIVPGTPMVLLGHNETVAWSHTYAAPKRHTIYALKLSPKSPTTYMYDGKPVELKSRQVTIAVRNPDGSLGKRSKLFWETPYGLMLKTDKLPWTNEIAFAIRDANMNLRWLSQQLGLNTARSVDDIDAAGRRYLGLSFINTLAVDTTGRVVYRDLTSIPNVTDGKRQACATTAQGKAELANPASVPVLDGWRSDCEWGVSRGTPAPGIFSADELPRLDRTDYAHQANDSHWINNPRSPLEGYPTIIGVERKPVTLRTREGLQKIEHRLSGADGLPGKGFTLEQLERVTMNNHVLGAVYWQKPLVALCNDIAIGKAHPGACKALANWDRTENLKSGGAVLFRRFFEHLREDDPFFNAVTDKDIFTVPFDPADPVNTPAGLNTGNPRVQRALAAAITELHDAGIPFDASLETFQFDERGGKRIPIPGGNAGDGQYNMIVGSSNFKTDKTWSKLILGSSFLMWVEMTRNGPKGRSVMAFSQSPDPASPHHIDQTELFSKGQSKPILFTDEQIEADPRLETVTICSAGSRC